jgi:hypothetical protein
LALFFIFFTLLANAQNGSSLSAEHPIYPGCENLEGIALENYDKVQILFSKFCNLVKN